LFVDLPDKEQRTKILSVLLKSETLDESIKVEHLASITEGYSGSDLKNLCIEAAYE
jgi:ATP-dependent Zn protease